MYLHIRIRPDGNGSIYPGTPEEIVKRYNQIRRAHERKNYTAFHVVYSVEVKTPDSVYFLVDNWEGTFDICKRGKHGAAFVGHSYSTFSGAVKRLARLVESEGGAAHE